MAAEPMDILCTGESADLRNLTCTHCSPKG